MRTTRASRGGGGGAVPEGAAGGPKILADNTGVTVHVPRTAAAFCISSDFLNMAAAMKEVLVCLGERKRGVSFASGDPDEEREALLQAIVEAFVDMKIRDDLVLQLKSEEWGGEFVDLRVLGTVTAL